MSSSISNLLYVERNVGGTFKSSKKQYIWEFTLNGERHKIELFDSKLSGKKKVVKNGIIECDTVCEDSFFKNFTINGHNCTIIQCGDKNELRIDNQTFEHLYNLERNKQFFSSNPEPTSSVYTAKSNVLDQNPGINHINFYSQDKGDNEIKPALFNFNIKPAGEGAGKGGKVFKFGKTTGVGVSREQGEIYNTGISNSNNNNKPLERNIQKERNLLDFGDVSDNNNVVTSNTTVQGNQNNNAMNDLMDIFGGNNNNNSSMKGSNNMQMNMMQNVGNNNLLNLGNVYSNHNNNQLSQNNFNQMNIQQNIMNPTTNNQNIQTSNNPFDILSLQSNQQSFPQNQSSMNTQPNPNNPFNNDLNSLFG